MGKVRRTPVFELILPSKAGDYCGTLPIRAISPRTPPVRLPPVDQECAQYVLRT